MSRDRVSATPTAHARSRKRATSSSSANAAAARGLRAAYQRAGSSASAKQRLVEVLERQEAGPAAARIRRRASAHGTAFGRESRATRPLRRVLVDLLLEAFNEFSGKRGALFGREQKCCSKHFLAVHTTEVARSDVRRAWRRARRLSALASTLYRGRAERRGLRVEGLRTRGFRQPGPSSNLCSTTSN